MAAPKSIMNIHVPKEVAARLQNVRLKTGMSYTEFMTRATKIAIMDFERTNVPPQDVSI